MAQLAEWFAFNTRASSHHQNFTNKMSPVNSGKDENKETNFWTGVFLPIVRVNIKLFSIY